MTMTHRNLLIRVILLTLLALPVFMTAIAQDESQITHVIQPGENLFRIAQRYGVDMNELAATNGITDIRRIRSGDTLIIPGLASPDTADEITNPLVAAPPITHIVQRGETLAQIARLYETTVDDILKANNIANINRIYPGQELQIWSEATILQNAAEADTSAEAVVAEPADTGTDEAIVDAPETTEVSTDTSTDTDVVVSEVADHIEVVHTVQPGEYLSQIARQYNVTWTQLVQANSISNPNVVYAGMELRIPETTAAANESPIPTASPAESFGLVNASVTEHPGAHVGTGRELVVDLSTQMAYAYEDGVLMRAALVSTGLPATPTVQGEFAIWHKTESQTMSGPGYYLPGVPYVMYFYSGYGFHGTYWHNNFGNPMSHGCVNMTNEDAKWFYDFASLGTPVYVQV